MLSTGLCCLSFATQIANTSNKTVLLARALFAIERNLDAEEERVSNGGSAIIEAFIVSNPCHAPSLATANMFMI